VSPYTLGLILHYLNSTMLEVSLSKIFTIVPTTVSRYIEFTLGILLFTFKRMKDAQIQGACGRTQGVIHKRVRFTVILSLTFLTITLQTKQGV
jgi:hypothetical protein